MLSLDDFDFMEEECLTSLFPQELELSPGLLNGKSIFALTFLCLFREASADKGLFLVKLILNDSLRLSSDDE